MLNWHIESAETACSMLKTDAAAGLSSQEAQKRLLENGENRVRFGRGNKLPSLVWEYLTETVSLILLCLALVSIVVAVNSSGNWLDPVLVLVLCPIRAIICAVIRHRSARALDAVRELAVQKVRVLRDGEESEILSEQLVPGDIMLIKAGDYLSADGRLFESDGLVCSESAIGGMSTTEKNAALKLDVTVPIPERVNLIYSGSSVMAGSGKAIVTATGSATEAGKSAKLLSSRAAVESPLGDTMRRIGNVSGLVLLTGCAVIFVTALLNRRFEMNTIELITLLAALCCCAYPWGLEAVARSALAEGAGRLAQKEIIAAKPDAVERLAAVSVICCDKTGALTENRMELVKAWANGRMRTVSAGRAGKGTMRLFEYASLCCDAQAEKLEDGSEKREGDATEAAIVSALLSQGEKKSHLDLKYPRLFLLPFDSERRLKSSVHKMDDKIISITKGAPEALLPLCSDEGAKRAWEICEQMSAEALRVLAVGFRELSAVPDNPNAQELEQKLTLIGLVGLQDLVREEVFDAAKKCRSAGVRVVMITGDHKAAAVATAKSVGIIRHGDETVTGAQLSAMSDDELDGSIRKYSVIARATHEDKLRIVGAWQRSGEAVAVIGDATDDAGSLNVAEAGFAMGEAGSSVARSAAAFTLKNDSFASVERAVEEGRGIFANVRHSTQYCLSLGAAMLLSFLLCLLIFGELPFSCSQLLIIFIVGRICSSALKCEPPDRLAMQRAPFRSMNGYLTPRRYIAIAGGGFLLTAITLGAYVIGLFQDMQTAQTMAFATLCLSQFFYAFSLRSDCSLFTVPFLANANILGSGIIAATLIFVVMLTLGELFSLAQLSLLNWIWVALLSISPLPASELSKFVAEQSLKLLNTGDTD